MPKLNLTFIQTIDIGLRQRLMKKLKQNAYYHKINILAEKSTNNILWVFKSFQYMYIVFTVSQFRADAYLVYLVFQIS